MQKKSFIKKLFPFFNPAGIRKTKKYTFKAVLTWCFRIFLVGLVALIFLFAWFAKDLPTPGKIKNIQTASATQIFDRNGKPLYAFHGDVRRLVVDSSSIPENVKKATIAAEDRGFYRHFGVEIKSIARSAYYDIIMRKKVQGGSTITQQYVKNALLDRSKTFTRKIKELILALEIEAMYSKDQILTMYLNEIPYGSNAYGIEAASKTFFGKSAKDLSLAESVTLAALPQAPTYYSPYGSHPDMRNKRINYILEGMVSEKLISREEADKAKLEVKNLKFAESHEYITAPHFVMYVKDKLIEEYGERTVDEGGLKITTTLDLDMQTKAEEAIKKGFERRFDNINASNSALVAIDPRNGQILSMVGSADFFNQDIDGQVNVADSLRQPGSSFKPIVYAAAFMEKYNPAYTLWDVTTDFGNYTPKNYDGATHGPVSIRKALAGSLNIPAVKILDLIGLDKALNLAHDMGITSLKDKDRYGLSLVLGGGEVKLTELTGAYGVFANNGKYSPTTPILKVEDRSGKVLEEYEENKNTKEIIDPQAAYQITSILSDNSARSYTFGSNSALHFADRNVAVKTGTTSGYRDAWTVGYTPSLVAGVWVGNNDNKPMSAGAAGAMAAAPIWHEFIQKALDDKPNEEFIKPEGITDVTVDKLSNKIPTSNSPETITDIFASWQVPKDTDDIHLKVKVDKFTGKLATDDCPDIFTDEKTYTNLHSERPDKDNWEKPVIASAEDFEISINYPPSEKSCSGLLNKPTIKIISPAEGSSVKQKFEINTEVSSVINVKSVEFFIDGKSIGLVNSKPYTIKAPELSKGKHKINTILKDEAEFEVSASVTISIDKDTSLPNNVSNVSFKPATNVINLYWTNPSDRDLAGINIYMSQEKGKIGNILTKVNTPQASVKISSLQKGQTYWFVLRAFDSSGNESEDLTQYSANPL